MPMTTTPPDPPPSAPPKRLIVVDDDKLFLSVFAANLQAGGYVPVCFDDSQAALAALTADTQASACVLDLDMPGLDGLAFLHGHPLARSVQRRLRRAAVRSNQHLFRDQSCRRARGRQAPPRLQP
jgi:CheY-like chemotaxis protein